MTHVTILGAGGNMGRRITRALLGGQQHQLHHVEPSERGQQLLAELGQVTTPLPEALAIAEVVVFAVPDAIAADVAADVVPQLRPGTALLFLDPAALAAERIVRRDDVSCYVTHPTHPPLYSLLAEESPQARGDYWGGGLAHQAVVFAVAWGDDGALADTVEQLARDMFAPVTRSHRITVLQMAMLEPALSETLTNGCLDVIREGRERVVAAGVPREAAEDFLMGHLQIGIALIFEQLDWKLSAGAALALEKARGQLFRDDWHAIFSPDAVLASVRAITGGE